MRIAKNPIKKNHIGLPCMLGEAVGRIVGYDENCATIDHNNHTFYSIILFSTPHGSIIKSGRWYISEITSEGMKKLIEYEEDAKSKDFNLYAGKISLKELEKLNTEYLNAQTN